MGLYDVAPLPIPIDGAPSNLSSLSFQRDVSQKATARAILQAYALPQRSFTKNIEAAQRQFESKLHLLFPYTFPPLNLSFPFLTNQFLLFFRSQARGHRRLD